MGGVLVLGHKIAGAFTDVDNNNAIAEIKLKIILSSKKKSTLRIDFNCYLKIVCFRSGPTETTLIGICNSFSRKSI